MLVIHRLIYEVTVKMISPPFKKEAKYNDRSQQNAQRKELCRLRDIRSEDGDEWGGDELSY